MKKKCELPNCNATIPKARHGNATTCCKVHSKLLQKINQKKYYKQNKQESTITKGLHENPLLFGEIYQDKFPFGNPNVNTNVSSENINNNITNPNNTSTSYSHNMYSTPELIKAVVNNDSIELIYKRQYMVSSNWGMPNPEIYKDIYSRNGGDVRRVIGTYIPAESETYIF